MKRIMVTGLGVTALMLVAPGQAHGAEMVAAAPGNCTTTYAAALESDVLVNGVVHDNGGTITVGGFTPIVFVGGAIGPTGTFVSCAV